MKINPEVWNLHLLFMAWCYFSYIQYLYTHYLCKATVIVNIRHRYQNIISPASFKTSTFLYKDQPSAGGDRCSTAFFKADPFNGVGHQQVSFLTHDLGTASTSSLSQDNTTKYIWKSHMGICRWLVQEVLSIYYL